MNGHPVLTMHTLRLSPGEDLRGAIEAACDSLLAAKDCQAACVMSSVGSLSCAVPRYAAETGETRLEGPLEMITLQERLPGQARAAYTCTPAWRVGT